MPDPIVSSSNDFSYQSYDELVSRDPSSPSTPVTSSGSGAPTTSSSAAQSSAPTGDSENAACIDSLVRVQSGRSDAAQFVNLQSEAIPDPVKVMYFDHGYDADGTFHADAAVLHGRDPETGFVHDFLAVSFEAGAEAEIGFTGIRVGVTGNEGRNELVFEGATANVALGERNPDGSTGFNISAGASLAGGHATYNLRGSSVTVGTAVGVSAGLSAGTRDSDNDGVPEYCFTASVGLPLSGGICIEEPKGWSR